jgi:thiamine pyrophosphokinase
VSRDAGLRGASRAQPALPDPDHAGGGNIDSRLAILRREDGFPLQRIIIFANGEIPNLEKARLLLGVDDFIICADGGAWHARTLGLVPKLVIGDMDSITTNLWRELEKVGVSIELFPKDKNETDLELAIRRAMEFEPKEILVVGALGGRFDQSLANIALLSNSYPITCNIRLDDGVEEIFFCRDRAQIHGRSEDIVSLIPWGGPVHGVATRGLKWQLNRETLFPEKTRGISNQMLADVASIKIDSGLLLVVHLRSTKKD